MQEVVMGRRHRRKEVQGTVYLLHFERKYKHAGHYMGWSENLTGRLDAHASGEGSRLMQVLRDAGIGFACVRTWSGTRNDERRLKNRKEAPRLCPVCRLGAAAGLLR
jgi:predicted GIY-YIG superfamily endonuclease